MKDISTEEEKRLEALASYDIMDTLPEEELDHITQLASIICETPIALISLLDHQRQWFKSKVGIEAPETPKNISFCQYAIQGMEVYEVENASESDLFKNNPLVTGDPNIRFYAGHPLTTDEGYNLGTLCVIDQKPKKLNANQKKALNVLASSIIQRLEIRKAKESEIKKNKLSELIIDVNKKFNQTEKTKDVFDSMLNGLLNILDCEYGFMGEIIESKNAKYLKTHSITDISWNKETKALFDENVANGLEFKNLNTLFGYTIRTGNELISNNPLSHKESGGLPKGHPPLNSYMGIPIMNSSNDLIAMIGLGNKKQGFKQSDLDFLKPFLSSYANIIQTIQARKNEKRLLTKLQKAQEIGKTGSWEYFFDKNYFEWSENLYALFEIEGSTSPENLFEVYLDKIGEEGKRHTLSEFNHSKSTGKPIEIELSFYRSDGERIVLKLSGQPIINFQQEIIGIEGSMVDVTNEIQTLDRLNNAQRIAKIGSWEFHFKDERLLWSDYQFEIFGIDPTTPPDALYKEYISRLKESDVQKLQSLIDHSIKTGEPYTIDHEITLPNGLNKMIRGNGNVLRDKYNKIIGLQGTAQDITEKYQKDKVLKEKEDRIKAMMDGSIDAIYLLDAFYNSKGEVEDFIFKEINKAGYRELDMKPEQLLGKKICEVFPVNITNGFFSNYKLVFDTKTNFEQEYELPEGTTAAGHYHHQVTPTETGVAIINRDISDIKQSVQRAQQTEAEAKEMSYRLQSVISAANIGIWNWNPQNNEVEFSDSWKAMLGYQPSEVSNHLDEWSKRVHPDDIEQCFSDIQAHIDGKTEFYRNEHRMLHKNGHWIWILDQGKIAERDLNGNPTKFVGTHLNIDIRKQQEQEIKEVKKEVEQFFDLSVDFMCISDLEGNFQKVNNSFKNILGYSEQEFLESSVLDFAHEDDTQITKDELKNLGEGKPVVNFKMRMKCQNGQYRWLNWCAQTNQNGTKIYAAARDVTEEFNLAEIEKKKSLLLIEPRKTRSCFWRI